MMIQTSHSEIFSGNVATDEGVRAHVPVVRVSEARVFRSPQTKERQDRFINSGGRIWIGSARDLVRGASTILRYRTEYALTGSDRGDCSLGRDALILSKPFVIREEKSLVL